MTKAYVLKKYFKKFYNVECEGMTATDVLQDYMKKSFDFDSKASGIVSVVTEMIDNELFPKGGGSSSSKSDVNFYDYDGTIVNSYTKDEFLALNDLPANPSHEGLVAQGWNYSLADAIDYVTKYGVLNIGQMYTTASGATEIDIELTKGRITPTLGICPNGTVTVDWGDGSTDTVSGTSLDTLVNTQHAYASAGKYTIKLTTNDSFTIVGNTSYYSQLLWDSKTSASSTNKTYQNAIKSVRIGEGVTSIGQYAFNNCYSLSSVTIPDSVTSISDNTFSGCCSISSVTIPDSVTSISDNTFRGCTSLSSVTIPDGVITIGQYAFSNCGLLSSVTIPDSVTSIVSGAFSGCNSLSSVTIPDSVISISQYAFSSCFSLSSVTISEGLTSIGGGVFSSCGSLSSVTIPDSVTNIGQYAFSSCYSMAEYHFKPTTPPTISSNTFAEIPSDCVIYVPTGSLTAYQSAEYWSTHASKMVEE